LEKKTGFILTLKFDALVSWKQNFRESSKEGDIRTIFMERWFARASENKRCLPNVEEARWVVMLCSENETLKKQGKCNVRYCG